MARLKLSVRPKPLPDAVCVTSQFLPDIFIVAVFSNSQLARFGRMHERQSARMRDHESGPHPVQSAIVIGVQPINRVPNGRLPIGDDLELGLFGKWLRHRDIARRRDRGAHGGLVPIPGEIIRHVAFMARVGHANDETELIA